MVRLVLVVRRVAGGERCVCGEFSDCRWILWKGGGCVDCAFSRPILGWHCKGFYAVGIHELKI